MLGAASSPEQQRNNFTGVGSGPLAHKRTWSTCKRAPKDQQLGTRQSFLNPSTLKAEQTNFHHIPHTNKNRIPRELPVLEEKAGIKRMLWNVFVWRSQRPLQILPNSQHSCGTDTTSTGEGKEMQQELLCFPQAVAELAAGPSCPPELHSLQEAQACTPRSTEVARQVQGDAPRTEITTAAPFNIQYFRSKPLSLSIFNSRGAQCHL